MPEERAADATTDETTANGGNVAVAENEAATGEKEEVKKKLDQQVTMTDAGPCKKHVKVSIARQNINERINTKFNEMMPEATVPGYRPGKAPRKLIEKKFLKEVREQLKAELLLESLEQMADDHKLNPIAQPNIDPFKIEIPDEGPLEYEFDVEVAPEFDIPPYKGLKLKRPVKEFSEDEVAKAQKTFLRNYGGLEERTDGAQMEDILVGDVTVHHNGQELRKFENIRARLDAELAFQDGIVRDFGERMQGAKTGESRSFQIHLAEGVQNPNMRGQVVDGTFEVKELYYVKLPELTHDFLHTVGVHNEEQLKEKMKSLLNMQLEYQQRQAAREQVFEQLAGSTNWELPEDLVRRQMQRTLNRRVMELRSAGYGDDYIQGRLNLLRQDSAASTIKSLKEHFVLQKIAEAENMEVEDADIDFELENIADQTGESVRKVRARIERDDLMDAVVSQIIERKALDLILQHAEYEDVPFEPEKQVSAVAGEMMPREEQPQEEQPQEAQPQPEAAATSPNQP